MSMARLMTRTKYVYNILQPFTTLCVYIVYIYTYHIYIYKYLLITMDTYYLCLNFEAGLALTKHSPGPRGHFSLELLSQENEQHGDVDKL